MDLVLVGTSHRTASVDSRGRLTGVCADARAVMAAVNREWSTIAECFVLATCHRVECYAVAEDSAAAEHELLRVVYGARGVSSDDEGLASYRLRGLAAVQHLCRVACGLDSLILGEAEIAGQIRRAAVRARDAGAVGAFLDRILAGALGASGRARSETRIGTGALSASAAAVALAEATLGRLAGRRVLVIGAGQAGRQALDRLAKRRPARLFVSSRSARHAGDAAARVKAEVVALDALTSVSAAVDLVIAATVAPRYLLDAAPCAAAWTAAESRERLLVDLSVPRVLDPALASVEGVTLRTVDDLGDIVRESTSRRLAEIPRVEAIVADEAARAYGRFRLREAGTVSVCRYAATPPARPRAGRS